MEITLEDLKRYSLEGFYNSRSPQVKTLRYMIEEIYKVIDINKIKVVYPKNLFVDDKQIEIYLFDNKGHIFRITCEDKEVITELYFSKDITRLRNKVNCENRLRVLTTEFSNGGVFKFDCERDTNSYYCDRFNNLIIDIMKLYFEYEMSNKGQELL